MNTTSNQIHGIVHLLRTKNFKVRIKHYRWVRKSDDYDMPASLKLVTKVNKKEYSEILGNGGLTEVELTTPDGQGFMQQSNCHENDGYNKKLGVRIALGRLAKKSGLDMGDINLINK